MQSRRTQWRLLARQLSAALTQHRLALHQIDRRSRRGVLRWFVTAAPGLTKLDGIALRNGKPYPAAMVLLVPQPLNQGNGIPRDQSDSDGTFTLPDVHPGRYSLLAIDHGRDLEYHNPKVLAPYLAHAETIDLPSNGAAAVQVNVQPRLKP